MNYTTALFLINDNLKAVYANYDPNRSHDKTMFKTLDSSIKVGDYIVVPSKTRYNLTCVKVVEIAAEPDLDASTPVEWVIQKVNYEDYQERLDKEKASMSEIKDLVSRRKKAALLAAFGADNIDILKSLPMASIKE